MRTSFGSVPDLIAEIRRAESRRAGGCAIYSQGVDLDAALQLVDALEAKPLPPAQETERQLLMATLRAECAERASIDYCQQVHSCQQENTRLVAAKQAAEAEAAAARQELAVQRRRNESLENELLEARA